MSKLYEVQAEADEADLLLEGPPPYREVPASGPVTALAAPQKSSDDVGYSQPEVITKERALGQTPPGPMLPVAIPQITTSWKGAFVCPFVRAWAPELGQRGLSQAEFLTFVDGFNEAFVGSPVLQGLSYAGLIMQQFYGLYPVQWAGIGLQVTSGLASAAVSYARARAYMKAANKKTFEPYGLHATVLTTKKLALKLGYPHEKVQLLPMDNTQMDDMSDAIAVDRPGAQVLSRRMQGLAGYVQPLSFDVLPSESSQNFMKRMGEWQARRLSKKQERKLDKKREKVEEAHDKVNRKTDKLERKVNKLEDKLDESREDMERRLASATAQENPRARERIEQEFARDVREIQRKIDKISEKGAEKVEKHSLKADKKQGRVDKKETRAVNKVRWIVISRLETAEANDEIQDEDGLVSLSSASSLE